jgi:hypothetical protein
MIKSRLPVRAVHVNRGPIQTRLAAVRMALTTTIAHVLGTRKCFIALCWRREPTHVLMPRWLVRLGVVLALATWPPRVRVGRGTRHLVATRRRGACCGCRCGGRRCRWCWCRCWCRWCWCRCWCRCWCGSWCKRTCASQVRWVGYYRIRSLLPIT